MKLLMVKDEGVAPKSTVSSSSWTLKIIQLNKVVQHNGDFDKIDVPNNILSLITSYSKKDTSCTPQTMANKRTKLLLVFRRDLSSDLYCGTSRT